MNINAATTTRDILGLAVLAVLHEKPSSRAETVDTVRALCMPWLTPSRDVLAGLVTEYCNLRFLHVDGNPQCRAARDPDDGCIEITEDGERELRRLAVYRTRQPAHSLVVLCESLRLSVAHRLDPETHEEILRGQICARRQCLARSVGG